MPQTYTLRFRCRSAFKLIEINERAKILQPGQTVVDCGAAPGSWTEIAVNETNANGKQKNKPKGFVIGLDLLTIHPIEVGACIMYAQNDTQNIQYNVDFSPIIFTGRTFTMPFGFHGHKNS